MQSMTMSEAAATSRAVVTSVAISPDGELVAAGGWTRISADDEQEQIYIFSAINGIMRQRIEGLPNVVLDLAFSPAGDRLVAALGAGGIRLVRCSKLPWRSPAERGILLPVVARWLTGRVV